MRPRTSLRVWGVLALVLTVTIPVLLLLPAGSLPSTAATAPDKLVHAALFFAWALSSHRAGLAPRNVVLWGLVLAGLTEIGQALMALGRHADVLDAAADLVGTVLGLGLSAAVRASER